VIYHAFFVLSKLPRGEPEDGAPLDLFYLPFFACIAALLRCITKNTEAILPIIIPPRKRTIGGCPVASGTRGTVGSSIAVNAVISYSILSACFVFY